MLDAFVALSILEYLVDFWNMKVDVQFHLPFSPFIRSTFFIKLYRFVVFFH